jgi:hypothetical protein
VCGVSVNASLILRHRDRIEAPKGVRPTGRESPAAGGDGVALTVMRESATAPMWRATGVIIAVSASAAPVKLVRDSWFDPRRLSRLTELNRRTREA